jgi:hypothetical protein
LVRRLFRDGLIPVVLTLDRTSRLTTDRLKQLIDAAVEFQYGVEHVDLFWQLPLKDRALIVDDYQRVPLRTEEKSLLLKQRVCQKLQISEQGRRRLLDQRTKKGHDRRRPH